MTLAAAGLTAFYSWRLVFKTFHGRPHDTQHFEAAHESPRSMLIPLFVLAVGSILAGLPFYHIFVGAGVEGFFRRIAEAATPRFWRRCTTTRCS